MKQILGILSVIVVIGAVIFVFSGKDHTNDPATNPSLDTSTTGTSTSSKGSSVQITQSSTSETSATNVSTTN